MYPTWDPYPVLAGICPLELVRYTIACMSKADKFESELHNQCFITYVNTERKYTMEIRQIFKKIRHSRDSEKYSQYLTPEEVKSNN